MKRPLLTSIAVLTSLLALVSVAGALVVIRPLSEAYLGDTSRWPTGLKEIVLRHKCVAGEEIVAPTWGNGIISAQLCFTGDESAFNAFLKEYAQLKHEGLVLTLHPGKGAFQSALQKTKEAVPFNWQLSVAADDFFKHFDKAAATTLGVDYSLGDRSDLKALNIPQNVKVRAGFDDKYREAHRDDKADKAIDAFMLQRQK